MINQPDPFSITIREAADKVFSETPCLIPASSIHTWIQQRAFVPFKKAPKPRSKTGVKLSEPDLVYLSVLRAMFQAGVRFHWSTSVHFGRDRLREAENEELDRRKDAGRGPQYYFELKQYKVYVHFRPLAYVIGGFIWFISAETIEEEFKQIQGPVYKENPNLQPHVFINVSAHHAYVQKKLSSKGLK